MAEANEKAVQQQADPATGAVPGSKLDRALELSRRVIAEER